MRSRQSGQLSASYSSTSVRNGARKGVLPAGSEMASGTVFGVEFGALGQGAATGGQPRAVRLHVNVSAAISSAVAG